MNDTCDNDTIAAIVGAAVGALHGASALPRRWIDGLTGRTSWKDDGEMFRILAAAKARFWMDDADQSSRVEAYPSVRDDMPDIDTLMDEYRRISFEAETPAGRLAIRVGQACPELDALLEAHGSHDWAFITACNPRSERLSDDENAARTRALREAIAARRLVAFEGDGVPDNRDWQPGASCLVLGLPQRSAIELGRQFGQLAIVVGTCPEPARLVRCDGPELPTA